MKSFVIAVIIFSLLIIAISANSIYMNKSVTSLIRAVEAIPEPDTEGFYEALEASFEEWKKIKKTADLSCSYSELSRIDLAFEDMAIFASEKNHSDYTHTKNLLIYCLSELTRLEKLSFTQIFNSPHILYNGSSAGK